MRTIVIGALASLAMGWAMAQCAPAAWRFDPWFGLLFGTALYMGAVHPWIVRGGSGIESGDGGRAARWCAARALGWRVAIFLAIAAGEVYAYYQWLPVSDLRAPFAMLSAWVVTESIGAPRAPTAVSPRV